MSEGPPLIVYGEDGATFARVCPKCGRYVKARETVRFNGLDELIHEPNADCKRCGPIEMDFQGYI